MPRIQTAVPLCFVSNYLSALPCLYPSLLSKYQIVCSTYTIPVYANVSEQPISLCVFLQNLCSIRRNHIRRLTFFVFAYLNSALRRTSQGWQILILVLNRGEQSGLRCLRATAHLQLHIYYIIILEAVPSSATGGRAMPW